VRGLGLPDHFIFFQGHFVFQRDTVGYFHGRSQEGQNFHPFNNLFTTELKMKQIYTLFCSFTLFILDSSMFNVINSSKMNNLKTIQEFSRTPENIQGQHVFQESRT